MRGRLVQETYEGLVEWCDGFGCQRHQLRGDGSRGGGLHVATLLAWVTKFSIRVVDLSAAEAYALWCGRWDSGPSLN